MKKGFPKEAGDMSKLKVGILALQGAFAKHEKMIQSLGADTVLVRTPQDLASCDALIIPGGESTTIFRQIHFIQLEEPLKDFAKQNPIFGTCAGLILMAKEVIGDPSLQTLGLLDIAVERNAFGRQAESFRTELEVFPSQRETFIAPAVFIRAPRIRQCTHHVDVLASFDNEPVLVKQGFHLGASFHPELTSNNLIHKYFLSMIKKTQKG
jgi:pyridoxal 5'-phosphate synthase pdxT subunit